MNSRCADCNHENCQCDRPPMPAAGPWRYDVVNVPRDGSDVLCEFVEVGCELHVAAGWSNDHQAWFDGFGRSYSNLLLTAFAPLNPPETQNDE